MAESQKKKDQADRVSINEVLDVMAHALPDMKQEFEDQEWEQLGMSFGFMLMWIDAAGAAATRLARLPEHPDDQDPEPPTGFPKTHIKL